MKTITVTLNPAIDRTVTVEKLYDGIITKPISEWICEGGKGVNVSTALAKTGALTEAVIISGRENTERFKKLINNKYRSYFVMTEGSIRENITIVSGNEEYKINSKGASVSKKEVSETVKLLKNILDKDDCLEIAGSLPQGLSKADIFKIAKTAKTRKAFLVYDSVALDQEELIKLMPDFYKPNRDEFEQLFGKKIETDEEIATKAEELHKSGIAYVIVSLGKNGMIAAGEDAVYKVCVPEVSVKTTVSAGDSVVAGFIKSRQDGKSFKDCLIVAAAYGTASVKCGGAVNLTLSEIRKIKSEIRVEKIK